MENIKNRLLKLTNSNLNDSEIVDNYPYLQELLNLINTDFPEINLVYSKEDLHKLIIARYVITYQEYINNKRFINSSQSLHELFRNSLFENLTISIYSEVERIMQNDFTEIYEELSYNEDEKFQILVMLSFEVYRELNGIDIYKNLYIPPYKNGYNNEEYNMIKELLSSNIYNILQNQNI